MKIDFNVKLSTVQDVKDFVGTTMNCPYSVLVSHGQFIVDGTSLLGLYSLDLSKPVKVTVESTGDEPINQDWLNKFNPFVAE